MQPKHISSTSNAIIKEAARLKRKRNRYQSRLFLVEGEDLLESARLRGLVPRQVFVLEGYENLVAGLGEKGGGSASGAAEVYACSQAVLAKLSELGSGSRVFAVFDLPENAPPKDLTGGNGPLVYLAGTSDPGNVGSIIRSAAALGASGVALAPETADPYSPKSLRATMGAIFQAPVYLALEPVDLISRARAAAVGIVCADPHHGDDVWDADLAGNFALVLGSERAGIPEELLDAAAATVRIPQSPKSESINVAMAGTVMLYEALRQRRAGGL